MARGLHGYLFRFLHVVSEDCLRSFNGANDQEFTTKKIKTTYYNKNLSFIFIHSFQNIPKTPISEYYTRLTGTLCTDKMFVLCILAVRRRKLREDKFLPSFTDKKIIFVKIADREVLPLKISWCYSNTEVQS